MTQTPLESIPALSTTEPPTPRAASAPNEARKTDAADSFQEHLSAREQTSAEPSTDEPVEEPAEPTTAATLQTNDEESDREQASASDDTDSTVTDAPDVPIGIVDEVNLTSADVTTTSAAKSAGEATATPVGRDSEHEPIRKVPVTEQLTTAATEEAANTATKVSPTGQLAPQLGAAQAEPEQQLGEPIAPDDETSELLPHESTVEHRKAPKRDHTPVDATGQQPTRTAIAPLPAETTIATDEQQARQRAGPRIQPLEQSAEPRPTPPPVDTTETESDDGTSRPSSSRFSDHLFTRHAAGKDRSPGISAPDQARLIDRVARAVQSVSTRGNTMVRLRLSPPELGSLRLHLEFQEGTIAARLETDNATTKNVLIDNVSVLRDRLSEQGIRLEQFDVDLLDRHSTDTADSREQTNHQHQSDDRPSQAESKQQEDTAVSVASDGQLNVIV